MLFYNLQIYAFIFFQLAINHSYSRLDLQNAVAKKPKNLNQKLFFSLGKLGLNMEQLQNREKIPYVAFMDENRSIDRENYCLDPRKFSLNLIRLFPNKKQVGYCYFDFESPFLDNIMHLNKGNPLFDKSLKIYVDAYKLGKKLRPNVIFGHYNIPFTSLEDPTLLAKNDKIAELMKVVDVLFPSIYLNNDYEQTSFNANYKYIDDNITNALKYSKRYNKPIYPFVMHRYHSEKPRLQFAAIKLSEWTDYLQMVTTTSYHGKFVDGIVWWGADDYFYNKSEGSNVRGVFKFTTQRDFLNQNDKILLARAGIALSIIR